jgi:hypothetical protein
MAVTLHRSQAGRGKAVDFPVRPALAPGLDLRLAAVEDEAQR